MKINIQSLKYAKVQGFPLAHFTEILKAMKKINLTKNLKKTMIHTVKKLHAKYKILLKNLLIIILKMLLVL